ncbi:MAG TPA: hypothetical protein VE981_16770 [Planctomycetota bacterium]|nr:hypothetical protein [Planctomycetota bacterium]
MKHLALFTLLCLGMTEDAAPPFVAHEWGTFTSVSGSDGVMIDWRPLLGADDLPKFVYRDGEGRGYLQGIGTKNLFPTRVRMETPVIYFYSDREREVSVKVAFPKGRITEWYPAAVTVKPELNWGMLKIVPKADVALPREAAESHYYPARNTDAALVRVWNRSAAAVEEYQYEKFLFYRGVGTFDLPLRATLDQRTVTIDRIGPDALSTAILFENSGGRVGFRRTGPIATRVRVERPELTAEVDHVMAELELLLAESGLYAKEARAMVETWRSSWFEEGLRVFYLVPRRATNEVLPLTIDPKPDQLVRVLVGRAEIITPEQELLMTALARKLVSVPEPARTAAQAELKKLGRFAEPTLRRVLATTRDAALQARIQELLK